MEVPRNINALGVQQAALKHAEKQFRDAAKIRSKQLQESVTSLFKAHLEEGPHPMQFRGGPVVRKVLAAQIKYLEPHVTSKEELELWRSELGAWRERCENRSLQAADILQLVTSASPGEATLRCESFDAALDSLLRSLEESAVTKASEPAVREA